MIKQTIEYELISDFYGDRCARRSKQPLMKHINEGLIILNMIEASDAAKQAFCLHPLLQDDHDLQINYRQVARVCNATAIMFAMEYRTIANEYLSHRTIAGVHEIRLSVINDVNDMLVADKVQNYSDFVDFHKGTHPRSAELDEYFNNWLCRLCARDIYDNFRNRLEQWKR